MTLDLEKCAFCGKAFVATLGHRPVCPECRSEENELYKRIRNLIRDHHDTKLTVSDVAKLLKVDEGKIRYFVEQGMFQLVRDNRLVLDEAFREFLNDRS